MHEEFNKIIGYEPIKRELDQLCEELVPFVDNAEETRFLSFGVNEL